MTHASIEGSPVVHATAPKASHLAEVPLTLKQHEFLNLMERLIGVPRPLLLHMILEYFIDCAGSESIEADYFKTIPKGEGEEKERQMDTKRAELIIEFMHYLPDALRMMGTFDHVDAINKRMLGIPVETDEPVAKKRRGRRIRKAVRS